MANRINEIDHLSNQDVLNRYRLDKGGIEFLEDLLARITPLANRNHSLTVRDKVLLTLRYLATGPIQLNDGDIHKVSQPTVSRVVTEVVDVLSSAEMVNRYINFPVIQERIARNKQEFFGVARFPKVVGVIDCTHIKIKAPSINEEYYVNRKGCHSINVQLVFDPFDRIIDIVSRWPGSVHDSRILQQSGLWNLFEGGHMPAGQHHLLGDSGYPCRPWLLTPYLNPQPGQQSAYNRSHKITRSKVERGIGQLKRRFGVLHGILSLKPEKVCKVILACAVLHNICKERNVPMPLGMDDNDENNGQDHPDINANHMALANGQRYRDYIAQTYF